MNKKIIASRNNRTIYINVRLNPETLGELIGRNGVNIKRIRLKSGANIDINGSKAKIYGTKVNVDKAKALILNESYKKLFERIREIEDKSGAQLVFDPNTNEIEIIAYEDQVSLAEELYDKYFLPAKVGQTYNEPIKKVLEFGLLVSLPNGETALIHKTNLTKPLNNYQAGELINATVIKVIKDGASVRIKMKEID